MMTSRKRKQEDDGNDGDTHMSRSPSGSPSLPTSNLPPNQRRQLKRPRTNSTGKPLGLSRLLETLTPDQTRSILKAICDRHPQLAQEVSHTAPRPSIDSVMLVLTQYENSFRNSFPFGTRPESDYAYNRVRDSLVDYLDALKDYTPTFLPPNESQSNISLAFLDNVTNMIHRLPNWSNPQNNRHKEEAYEEIGKAWANVIREAAKRGGGIQLRIGQWDQKMLKHNETSGNRLLEAIHALNSSTNWMDQRNSAVSPPNANDPGSIRQQLMSGTYGEGVRLGPW
jgi:protein Cut8